MRKFSSGATRDSDDTKIDFEGFLSPLVLRRFGEYMNRHRVQADGELRDSDNWQLGIPRDAYMKSMWRHFYDVWCCHRGHATLSSESQEEELCALLFNVQGYLHELLKSRAALDSLVREGQAWGDYDLPNDHPLLHVTMEKAP